MALLNMVRPNGLLALLPAIALLLPLMNWFFESKAQKARVRIDENERKR